MLKRTDRRKKNQVLIRFLAPSTMWSCTSIINRSFGFVWILTFEFRKDLFWKSELKLTSQPEFCMSYTAIYFVSQWPKVAVHPFKNSKMYHSNLTFAGDRTATGHQPSLCPVQSPALFILVHKSRFPIAQERENKIHHVNSWHDFCCVCQFVIKSHKC